MKSSRPGGRRSGKEVWGGPEEGVHRQQCPGCSQIWRDRWEGISRNCRTWERGLGAGGVLANLACVALGSSLLGMGVKRSLQRGGILLGFLAKILMILSTATNYWIRYPGGHRGLWQECNAGTCSNIPCQSEARPAQVSPTGQTAPSTDHSWHNSWAHPAVPPPSPLPLQSQAHLLLHDRDYHKSLLWDLLACCDINCPS